MKIDSMVVGPLGVNCYIISNNGNAVIVDPGGNAGEIIEFLSTNNFKPAAIVNTHGHFDHIGGIDELVRKYNIPFYLHADDEFLCAHGSETAAMFGFDGMKTPIVTNKMSDDDELDIAGIKIKVLHTPGHTPGGVSLYVKDLNSVMTGDTIFLESIGRSDFPYGDHDQLIKSIKTELMALDESIVVLPGHGPASSIGHEKSYNPFL
ncbi:MAG: MBL fold hydrolase [Denitrovibrio sp.]|nr:MAG: MBL fold hydrolase [Denitrovibrio sp.]